MNKKIRHVHIILNTRIEDRFPFNYDVVQELVENANELFDCVFVPHWACYEEESKYVEYMAFQEVLVKFFIAFVNDLLYIVALEDIKTKFLAYRLLFNLISNGGTKIHIGVLNNCKDTNKAWELFNRIQYLINNFETEILLSDTGDTEDV